MKRNCHSSGSASITPEDENNNFNMPSSPESFIQSSLRHMSVDDVTSRIPDIPEVSCEDYSTSPTQLHVNDENNAANADRNSTSQENNRQKFGNSHIRNFRQALRQNLRKKNNQICLQRLSQRMKKTGEYFWSGYMYYYTNESQEFLTHYWKLDSTSIAIYDSYRLEKKLMEIELTSVRRAYLCGVSMLDPENANNVKNCLFVIRTDTEAFYCGMGNADPNSTMNVLARNFYNIFKMVYLPYGNRNGFRKSLKITAPKYEEKSLQEEYTINPRELLGSGQFGQVYGGVCNANYQPVAIKVIDKTRFKDFHAETSVFQNEITILYNVHHQGIVKLFALFDEVDHVKHLSFRYYFFVTLSVLNALEFFLLSCTL